MWTSTFSLYFLFYVARNRSPVQWQLIVQLLLVTVALATDPKCPQEHKPDSAVMYPHTADCRKFYVCLANRMLVEKECPEGHQFDAGAAVRIKFIQIEFPTQTELMFFSILYVV